MADKVLSSNFLTLPPEVREHIYSIILRSANNRYEPPLLEGWDYSDDPKAGPRYQFALNILLVNRLIHQEAKKVFQDNIFVKITTPFPGAIAHVNGEGKVAYVVQDQQATDFQDFHLRILIDTPANVPWRLEHDETYSMVTCMEDIEAFTQIWYFSNLNSSRHLNPHLTLRLDLKNPYTSGTTVPRSLQEKLLLPFGRVKDLDSVSFDFHGNPFFEDCAVYPSIRQRVLEEQAIPVPTPEECLAACQEQKHKGQDLVARKDYEAALQEYTTAFSHIHITVSGRKRDVHCESYYSTELTSGRFKGQNGSHVRLLLRMQLVSAVMQALLLLENFEEAYFWGQRSIRLLKYGMVSDEGIGGNGWEEWVMESSQMIFPGKADMAWVFYRAALAKRGIGKTQEDEEEIKALLLGAKVYGTGDEMLGTELAALQLREYVKSDQDGKGEEPQKISRCDSNS